MISDGFPQPAQVDFDNERQVMWHMRHLLNLFDLLGQKGYQEEMYHFREELLDRHWSREKIDEMLQEASEYTRYESLLAIDPVHGPRGYFNDG